MQIDVALATCDGDKYLGEQLRSLRDQSCKPQRLVVVDDASTDGTREILNEFQRSAPFEVSISSQATRQGPVRTFLRAADACTAEAIAFCDQDDVWHRDKLRITSTELARREAPLVLHSMEHIQQRGDRWVVTSKTQYPSRTVDGLSVRPEHVFRGMGMLFERRLLPFATRLQQLWDVRFSAIETRRAVSTIDHWSHTHDLLLFMTARVLGNIRFVRRSLALQRWHPANFTAVKPGQEVAPPVSTEDSYRGVSAFCADLATFLRELTADPQFPHGRVERAAAAFVRWADIFATRAELHSNRTAAAGRVRSVRRLLRDGGYRPELGGGLGIKSLVKDVLTSIHVRVP